MASKMPAPKMPKDTPMPEQMPADSQMMKHVDMMHKQMMKDKAK